VSSCHEPHRCPESRLSRPRVCVRSRPRSLGGRNRCRCKYGDTDDDADTHPNGDANSHTDANPDGNYDSHANCNCDTNTHTHTDADIHSNTDIDTDCNSDAHSDVHVDANTHDDVDCDIGTDSNHDADTDSDGNADADRNTDDDTDAQPGAGTVRHLAGDAQQHVDRGWEDGERRRPDRKHRRAGGDVRGRPDRGRRGGRLEAGHHRTDSDDQTATTQADRSGEEAPAIEVVSATVPADWVREGFDTTVRATVVNRVDRRANRTLAVTVDDRRVGNKTVTLPPNQREVVSIEFDAASGTVAVEGVDAGRIEVRETQTPGGPTSTDTPGGTGSGFGLVLTVFVVALVAGRAAVRASRR
jgi:hypothetical protein